MFRQDYLLFLPPVPGHGAVDGFSHIPGFVFGSIPALFGNLPCLLGDFYGFVFGIVSAGLHDGLRDKTCFDNTVSLFVGSSLPGIIGNSITGILAPALCAVAQGVGDYSDKSVEKVVE